MSAEAATRIIVTICEHDRPIGARVDTEDDASREWLKEELLAIHDGRIENGRIEYWLRHLKVDFCDECDFGGFGGAA